MGKLAIGENIKLTNKGESISTILQFVGCYLQPVVKVVPFYIRDTNDFVNKVILQHNKMLRKFRRKYVLSESATDSLKVTSSKKPRFYISPNIHKDYNPCRQAIKSFRGVFRTL